MDEETEEEEKEEAEAGAQEEEKDKEDDNGDEDATRTLTLCSRVEWHAYDVASSIYQALPSVTSTSILRCGPAAAAPAAGPSVRGVHSSTSQLNLSRSCH